MDYTAFVKEIYKITNIDLNMYKEKQMKRRINSLIAKNHYKGYEDYLEGLKTDKALFNEFLDYITINVSEFYRNPEQWDILDREILPDILKKKSIPKNLERCMFNRRRTLYFGYDTEQVSSVKQDKHTCNGY